MDATMPPRFLLVLFTALFAVVTIASPSQSGNTGASDTENALMKMLGINRPQERPPRNDSTTATRQPARENSPDYVRQLLLMFGPIRGNTMHGFTDISELI